MVVSVVQKSKTDTKWSWRSLGSSRNPDSEPLGTRINYGAMQQESWCAMTSWNPGAWRESLLDAAQRSVLYADLMRQRGIKAQAGLGEQLYKE